MSHDNDIIILNDDDDDDDEVLDVNNNVEMDPGELVELGHIADVRYNGRELEYRIVWPNSTTTWERDIAFIGGEAIDDLLEYRRYNVNKIADVLRCGIMAEARKAKEEQQMYAKPSDRPTELWQVRGADYDRRINMGFKIRLEKLNLRRLAYNSTKSTSLIEEKNRSATYSNRIPRNLHIPVEMNGRINHEIIDMKMDNDMKNLCPTMIERLSRTMWKIFEKKRQPRCRLENKLDARDELDCLLTSFFHDDSVSVYICGSTISGSALKYSNLDLIFTKSTFSNSEEEAMEILKTIKNAWERKSNFQQLMNYPHLVLGKEPILNFSFRGKYSGIECNLRINNLDCYKNSNLFAIYSNIDVRFSVLMVIVKLWAEEYELIDPKNHFLTSYTLMLMVLHFLQSGTYPQLLPNLQGMFPERFVTDASLKKLFHLPGFEQLLQTRQKNNTSIGELLIQFFVYYSHFDFANYEIDCKNCRSSRRSPISTPAALSVLDPINSQNTAINVQPKQMEKIIEKIQTAKRRIRGPLFELRDIRVHA